MQDFRRHDYTIKEADLLRVLREAASHGCMSWIVINGEYYTVRLNPEKIPSADPGELF